MTEIVRWVNILVVLIIFFRFSFQKSIELHIESLRCEFKQFLKPGIYLFSYEKKELKRIGELYGIEY